MSCSGLGSRSGERLGVVRGVVNLYGPLSASLSLDGEAESGQCVAVARTACAQPQILWTAVPLVLVRWWLTRCWTRWRPQTRKPSEAPSGRYGDNYFRATIHFLFETTGRDKQMTDVTKSGDISCFSSGLASLATVKQLIIQRQEGWWKC